jgi:hypothetical protein
VTRLVAWLAGIVMVVAAIAAFAPATLVAALVADATRGELRLANARGTAWSGAADAAIAGGQWTIPVTWTLAPLALLNGEARIALRSPGGASADLVLRDGAIVAHDVALAFPAEALRLPAGTAAGGELRVAADTLVLAPDRHEGRVRIEWARARLALPGAGALALGTASATLVGEGARWRGPLEARGGALVVDGEASVDRAGADVTLAIVPQPDAPQAARAALGGGDAQGRVRLNLRPRFR